MEMTWAELFATVMREKEALIRENERLTAKIEQQKRDIIDLEEHIEFLENCAE